MIEYEYVLRTDIGTRDEQQDYADVKKYNGMVFAVLCDGMGGHKGGSEASHIAVNSFLANCDKMNTDNIPAFFINKAEYTNKLIYDLADENGKRLKAGTTLVSVIIKEDK